MAAGNCLRKDRRKTAEAFWTGVEELTPDYRIQISGEASGWGPGAISPPFLASSSSKFIRTCTLQSPKRNCGFVTALQGGKMSKSLFTAVALALVLGMM